jgi:hypothetical protein
MWRKSLVHALTVACLLAVAAGPAGAQPTVQVHVLVADRSRRPVRGLGSSDFEVLENGRARPVLDVRDASAPLEMMILLDASSSLIPRFDVMARATERLVEPLRADDRSRVGLLTTRLAMLGQVPDPGEAEVPGTEPAGVALELHRPCRLHPRCS